MHIKTHITLIAVLLFFTAGLTHPLLSMEISNADPSTQQEQTAQSAAPATNRSTDAALKYYPTQCTICLEEAPVNRTFLTCGHGFCKICLEDAFKSLLFEDEAAALKCPICRSPSTPADIEKLDLRLTPDYIRSAALRKMVTKLITFELLEPINNALREQLTSPNSIALICEAFDVPSAQAAEMAQSIIEHVLPITIDSILSHETFNKLMHILLPTVTADHMREYAHTILERYDFSLPQAMLNGYMASFPALKTNLDLISSALFALLEAHDDSAPINPNPLEKLIPQMNLVALKILLPIAIDALNEKFPLLAKRDKRLLIGFCGNFLPIQEPKLILPLLDEVFPLELNRAKLHETASRIIEFICCGPIDVTYGKIHVRPFARKIFAKILTCNPQIMKKFVNLKLKMLMMEKRSIEQQINDLRGYNPFYVKLGLAAATAAPLVYCAIRKAMSNPVTSAKISAVMDKLAAYAVPLCLVNPSALMTPHETPEQITAAVARKR